jgi:hypothetical protein
MDSIFKKEVTRLYPDEHIPAAVTKVGILPFIIASDGSLKILFMKPRAEAKKLGAPAFQIAKGTRRINVNGDWCDMREDDLIHADESFYESLLGTALREGQEEVGLQTSNILRLFDMGGFTFVSASRKTIKPLHMFAAELANTSDFIAFEATTAETSWMSVEEFAKVGRTDHIAIAGAIIKRLKEFL